jgi:hypothetical protein
MPDEAKAAVLSSRQREPFTSESTQHVSVWEMTSPPRE